MHHAELRAKRDALESLWRQGLSGQSLLHKHSQLIDEYISQCFAGCPEAGEGMTFIALGGYGRKELFPFSDIDLLLLYEPQAEERLSAVTEAIFYPLWDAGLEVGHGVRTPQACLTDARKDFFFQVALLDARPITGSESLFAELKENFRQDFVEGHRRDFLKNMVSHRKERHRRFGMHSYLLEPHIKESRGGFRDIQAMLWVAQAVYGLRNIKAMEEAGLLTSQERQNFDEAREHLIRIRNRLHYVSGRKNDQLYFEHQEEMAHAFKYRTANGILAVEQFMRDVYGHLQSIGNITDLFFEHIDETLGLTPVAKAEQVIEAGLSVRLGRLHLTDQSLIAKRPYLLMRLFAQASKTGFPIHHRTAKLVNSHLCLIDDKLRHSRRMAKAFQETLEGPDAFSALTAMLDTGLLTAYIPEFTLITSLAQHDVYHAYTVDRHLLQTVAGLKSLQKDKHLAVTQNASILYLAAFFHDIGKGHTDDHAERGAKLAQSIGERLGLSEDEISQMAFLIRHHLFLPLTALRRDLEDEVLIAQCGSIVKNHELLHMLYLLAIADSKATGPTVWNEWKGALFQELYLKIAHFLDRTEHRNPDKAQGAEWMRSRIRGILDKGAEFDLTTLPEEYLLSFSPETVAQHINQHKGLEGQKALLCHEDKGAYWSVLIMTRDSTGLLAKICGTLALHNLTVVEAQIHTWPDATAVDVLNVRQGDDMSYASQDWNALEQDLNMVLANRLGLAHRLADKQRSSRYGGHQHLGPRQEPRVVIDNHSSEMYTIIEVYTENMPELLHGVTRTLAEFGINIFGQKSDLKVTR